MMYSIEEIQEFINRIEAGEFTLPEEVLSIEGYSSRKIKQLLNRLCSKPDTTYLEIGLHVGSTFIPALYNNPIKAAVGIDNWSLPDDFNWAEPREETYHALKDLNYEIVHEWLLPAYHERDTEQWWNGLFVGMIR